MSAQPDAQGGSDDGFCFVDSFASSESGASHDDAPLCASQAAGSTEAPSDLERSGNVAHPEAEENVASHAAAAPATVEVLNPPPFCQAPSDALESEHDTDGPSPEPSSSSAPAMPCAPSSAEPPSEDEVCTLEWSQSECHMQDIRYAEKKTAAVAPRKVKQQLKIMFCGPPETGKTTAVRNLMASLTGDPDWTPNNVAGLSAADFLERPAAFETRIEHRSDDSGHFELTYILQEAPPLSGDPDDAASMLTGYIKAQHAAFAEQEQSARLAREDIEDTRVDVVLYFLPTNARVSAFDSAVMARLCEVALVIPVMCKADCLDEAELADRKGGMARLIEEGLRVWQFPEAVLAAVRVDSAAALRANAVGEGADAARAAAPPTPLGLPFMIMAGNVADESVHPFWFVRKYRWGMCEAYREVDSDLKYLRRLLLDEGFWCLKDAADALYRRLCVPAPKTCEAKPEVEPAPQQNNPFCGMDELRTALGAADPDDPLAPRAAHSHSNSLDAHARSASSSADDPCWAASVQAAVEAGDEGGTSQGYTGSDPPGMRVRIRRNRFRTQTFETQAQAEAYVAANAPPGPQYPSAPAPQAPAQAQGPEQAQPPAQPQPVAQVPVPVPELPTVAFNEDDYEMVHVSSVTRNGGGFRLTLHIPQRDRVLCMRVGYTEGCCLASALEARASTRPCTYDSWKASLDLMGCNVLRAVVTKCAQTIFYSSIHTLTAAGGVTSQDARPSDAINLAVRFEAPVYVSCAVIDAFSKPISSPK